MATKKQKNDAVVSALAHPLRREILRALEGETNGGISPSQMAEQLGQPLPNLSYHIRMLVDSGVLKLVKTKPRRGAIEHFYKRSGNHLDKKVEAMLKLIGKD